MAYNVTKEQKDDAALKDTQEKLKREAIMTAALLAGYFRPLSKFFFDEYKKTGLIPNESRTCRINFLDVLVYWESRMEFKFW